MKKQARRGLVLVFAAVVSTVASAQPSAIDLSSIVAAADMDSIITGVIAVAASIAGVLVVQRAIWHVHHMIIGRDAAREQVEWEAEWE